MKTIISEDSLDKLFSKPPKDYPAHPPNSPPSKCDTDFVSLSSRLLPESDNRPDRNLRDSVIPRRD